MFVVLRVGERKGRLRAVWVAAEMVGRRVPCNTMSTPAAHKMPDILGEECHWWVHQSGAGQSHQRKLNGT